MMPLPHRIRVRRKTSSLSDDGIEVVGGATLVYDSVKALISPSSTSAPRFGFGQEEREDDLIFLAARDEDDQPYSIQADDLLIDITPGSDDENDVWVAVAPGNKFENPVTFFGASPVPDHIEVPVARTNIETGTL